MRGTFPETIAASWEWTKTVLFRPFQIKKWLILGFVALLSGQLIYGCHSRGNFNLPTGKSGQPAIEETTGPQTDSSSQSDLPLPLQKFLAGFKKINKVFLGTIIIFVFSVFLFLLLISTWLYSRFSFIFLEAVVRNDASIKKPFRENRNLGNSFFIWNIIISLINLFFMGLLGLSGYLSLARIGLFTREIEVGLGKIFLVVLPFVFLLAIFWIILILLNFVVRNFILPVMYREKMNIWKAWPPVLSLLNQNKGSVLGYLLIKAGLFIIASLSAGAAGMLILLGLILPLGIIGGIVFVGYKIMPGFLEPVYIGSLIIIGLPVLLTLGFFINCLFLPLPVFFQAFSLKFLARLEERYDLFRIPADNQNI